MKNEMRFQELKKIAQSKVREAQICDKIKMMQKENAKKY
jgi:hypothetical protein